MYSKRFVIVLILFTMTISYINGQETKNQNDSINKDFIKTISGIELKIEGPYAERFSSGSTLSPISIDYIKEIKIFKTTTLIIKGGCVIIPKILKNIYPGETIFKPLIGNELNHFNWGINFEVEPRWYWKISNKRKLGKINTNSGWYLSFPIESNIPIDFSISTLDNNYEFNDFQDVTWIKDFLRVYYNFGPAIGYKYAFSNNWYIETMIQMKAYNFYIMNNQNHYYGTTEINPQLKIKVAYVFNRKQ